ncbi:MAG: response regulator [Anaerolineae bacterium]|nr:response regulator [Anaerolineae bacterium]
MNKEKQCILIVDDDKKLTNLFEVFMCKNGYDVRVANSGSEGLRLARECDPMLVILDVMMPKMDGWTVCERLREFSDVPVIILTARGTEQDMMAGVERGADDYIVKPFRVKELLGRIESLLARKIRS